MFNFDLSQDIEDYLLANPVSTEFKIITHLQATGRLHKKVLANPLSLFRCHFLIFNALYRLQYSTFSHQKYHLDISSVGIRLSPCQQTDAAPSQPLDTYSPLGLFYLDLSQLSQIREQDVNKLLDQFWQHYFSPQQKTQALITLQFHQDEHPNLSFKCIKKQYRRLVMQHHPDRGGDADRLIAIQQAMQCLEHYYP
ncbi:MAG: DNA-J related domain-containing protein [Bermanella sp.]